MYQRLKLKQTAAELNGVPSWNVTPLRSWNVQVLPFLEAFQLVASLGTTTVPPGFRPTSPSKIWITTRPDSPSEISAPSSTTGSAVVPKTSVPLARDLPNAPAARTDATTATTASGTTTIKALPLNVHSFQRASPRAIRG